MTNIKTRGFDSAAQLREHLAELEDEAPAADPVVRPDHLSAEEEVASLRAEVADLRERLLLIRAQTSGVEPAKSTERQWWRIAAAVAATVVLGRLVQRLRLGAGGAAAVPLIVAQLHRRAW